MQVYTAGPFFNDVQEAHAFALAQQLRDLGFGVYAPVEEKFREGEPGRGAVEIFDRNILWMTYSDVCLFQLDYPMTPGCELHVCDGKEPTPISLPDMGTVWELGFAFALKKWRAVTLIGYYTGPVPKVNLMIAQSLDGIAENITDVFLPSGELNLSALVAYNGKQI